MHNSVSVVIPTYNRSDLVVKAIKSVLAAMTQGDEILVIDDGSIDDTPTAVGQFGDAIRYIKIENSGPGAARHVGIRMAECPFVAFLDSDDLWVPDKLELQRKVLEAFPSVVFCFSNLSATLSQGEIWHDILSKWRTQVRVGSDAARPLTEILGPAVPYSSFARLPDGRDDFNVHVGDMYAAEMEACCVISDSVLVRKGLAGDQFRYPEDIRLMEDWECFARLSKIGPAAYLDCELADWGNHNVQRLTDADEMKHIGARIALLQRVWGSDESYLRAHSARYRNLLADKCLLQARLAFSTGQMHEAREVLKIFDSPLTYRLISRLPSAFVKNVLNVRRTLLRRTSRMQ